jgi:hypothetical protein
MDSALRPLTTGELLDRTFQIYRKNFVLFAGISAVPVLLVLSLRLGTLAIRTGGSVRGTTAAISAMAFGWGLILLSFIASSVSTAATTFGVSDVYLSKPTSIAACYGRVKGRLLKVLLTSIAYSFIMGFGFVLLFVPGIYWLGKYGLAVSAAVLEEGGVSESLGRSSDLSKGSIGRVLLVFFLTWILIVVVTLSLGALLGAVGTKMMSQIGVTTTLAIQYVLNSVASLVVSPIMAIGLTLLYYDQRVRKEAFDIENMMSLLGEPPQGMAAGASQSL